MSASSLISAIHGGAVIEELGGMLDGMTSDERRAATRELGKQEQRLLYVAAAGGAPSTLDAFVPAGLPPLQAVNHHGLNTLPLPAWGKRFIKCMARDESGTLVGYNDSPFRLPIGPGFFVLRETAGEEAAHGAVVVDYYQVPSGRVPEAWPRVRPNWLGLQVLVYHQTRDYMRRVSEHVSIGAAFKWGRALDNYFVLCRED